MKYGYSAHNEHLNKYIQFKTGACSGCEKILLNYICGLLGDENLPHGYDTALRLHGAVKKYTII
jgi:hypothetical protein